MTPTDTPRCHQWVQGHHLGWGVQDYHCGKPASQFRRDGDDAPMCHRHYNRWRKKCGRSPVDNDGEEIARGD